MFISEICRAVSGVPLMTGLSQEDAAAIVEGAAKQNCPVDTGALRESIHTDIYRGAEAAQRGGSLASSLFSVVAEVQPDMPYAGYVEFGTGRRGAGSPGAGPFEYRESWPGQAAQPYMRPAADDNRDACVEAIKSAVQDALS